MRSVLALVVGSAILAAATPARAELKALGGYALGQKVKRPTARTTRLYGCRGQLRPAIDRRHRIVSVRFVGGKCNVRAVASAITRAFGKKPQVNPSGDRLWEGKSASVILSTSHSLTRTMPIIALVAPARASKRTCWGDDGFQRFWSGFRTALARDDSKAIARSFAFPLKDSEGTVKYTSSADLAAGWDEVLDRDDAALIASGKLTPSCRFDTATYRLQLDRTYAVLKATRRRGAWRWTSVDLVSPD